MHQLMTEDPTNVAKESTVDAVGGGFDGNVEGFKCFPPTPSMTINAITLGIHAKLSYLREKVGVTTRHQLKQLPVHDFVSKECHLRT